MKTKYCKDCDRNLPLSAFCNCRSFKDGLNFYCKECAKKREQRYQKTPAYKKRCRKSNLKFKYGISLEEYDRMFESQEGKCAVCGKPETQNWRGSVVRLSVDHDHKSDKVRELLCHNCNSLLGLSNENPELLKKTISYLEKHNCRTGINQPS